MKSATWARLQTQKNIDYQRETDIRYLKSSIMDGIRVATLHGKSSVELECDEGLEDVAREFIEKHGYTFEHKVKKHGSVIYSNVMIISW